MIETLRPIAEAIRARGGRAIAVGGFVRDRLLCELGRPAGAAKDLDVEVFGLSAPELADALRGFGEVIAYGRSFPVMRVVGREIDFALPRAEHGPDPRSTFRPRRAGATSRSTRSGSTRSRARSSTRSAAAPTSRRACCARPIRARSGPTRCAGCA